MITVFGNFDEGFEPSTCLFISFYAPFSPQEVSYQTCDGRFRTVFVDPETTTRPECILESSIFAGPEVQIINNGPCGV